MVTNAAVTNYIRLVDSSPQDGIGDGDATTSSYSGDIGANNDMSRMLIVFALPKGGEKGYSVREAVFSLSLRNTTTDGNLPDLDVDLIDKGSASAAVQGDYQAPALATLNSLGTPATAAETIMTWRNGDLAEALSTAYSNGSAYVAFRPRLALTGDFYDAGGDHAKADGDANNDYYSFNRASDGFPPDPTLELILVPYDGIVTTGTLVEVGRAWDQTSPKDGVGDAYDNQFFCGDINSDRINRALALFELPPLPALHRVARAEFEIVYNLPNTSGDPSNTNRPPLDFAFVDKGTASSLAAGDYEAASLALLEGVATVNTPNYTPLTWKNADLATAVRAAYANDSTHVLLRMQFALTNEWVSGGIPQSDNDGLYDTYGFEDDDPAPA
ncbi:MAG: hypothetical protein JW951_07410, partial [Lentisphaerae bacterium]|nr:hypothetical protein [Lentisphaerota bacterium]